MKYEHQGKKKNILILDTEGIQSAEARDNYFDKRIVYFVLCVSHVVLFVNKGEMNSEMAEVVKMVNEAVKNTEEEFIKNPSIFIILNKMSQVTNSTAAECVKILQDNQNQSDQIVESSKKGLKFSEDDVVPLQYAFETSNFGPGNQKSVNKPSK